MVCDPSPFRAEITERAWGQIATAGASALSLNAIAKQLGMSGPALYRYFASRDELITELVREAYRSLADTLRTAAADGGDLAGLAYALPGWAQADPQRYFLVYGTPVPGYRAPEDTTALSDEIKTTLLDACAALAPDGVVTLFGSHLEDHRDWAAGHSAPPGALHRFLTCWPPVLRPGTPQVRATFPRARGPWRGRRPRRRGPLWRSTAPWHAGRSARTGAGCGARRRTC
ncbi:TetR/AcrR family transcriptional regulator [Streptomyces sp. NPDC048442]|uniref:TetR/AcrR family transcriptional regulator n=1 Tax=Streptomyces sp. NPDC048442 TaxID=3154823 RepID=UPI0034200CC7